MFVNTKCTENCLAEHNPNNNFSNDWGQWQRCLENCTHLKIAMWHLTDNLSPKIDVKNEFYLMIAFGNRISQLTIYGLIGTGAFILVRILISACQKRSNVHWYLETVQAKSLEFFKITSVKMQVFFPWQQNQWSIIISVNVKQRNCCDYTWLEKNIWVPTVLR